MSYEEDFVRASVPDASDEEAIVAAEWMRKMREENPTAMGFQFSRVRDEDIWHPSKSKRGHGRRRRRASSAG